IVTKFVVRIAFTIVTKFVVRIAFTVIAAREAWKTNAGIPFSGSNVPLAVVYFLGGSLFVYLLAFIFRFILFRHRKKQVPARIHAMNLESAAVPMFAPHFLEESRVPMFDGADPHFLEELAIEMVECNFAAGDTIITVPL
ncbi:hypothetical protein T484DRAFT_1830485, partial [Baffinella frigidus]